MERRVEPKQASAGAPARAMVCHAPEASAPAALLEALQRRAFVVELVAGTHRVVARAVAHRHAPATSAQKLVVVLVEPGRLARPAECLEALRMMPGGVACWVFDAPTGELRAASAVDVESWSEKKRVQAASEGTVAVGTNRAAGAAYDLVARAAPSLRLTGDWPDAAQANGLGSDEPAQDGTTPPMSGAAASLLTDEELDMLLGDDPGLSESDRGAGGQ